MKKFITLLVVIAASHAGNLLAQLVSNLDNLNYWGSGPNRAAFVVYWNDSKSPDGLAWGYKWSGTQTVADMFLNLASYDPLLFARLDSITGFGVAIFGIGYQTGSAPFGVTGAQDTNGNPVTPNFINGIDDLNTGSGTQSPASSTAAAPLNPADRYKEGWNNNGFWELFNSGTSNNALQASYTFPTTWTSSTVGASSLTLVPDSWAAFSISNPDFTSNPPTTNVVAAIPEPSALILIAIAPLLYLLRKRPA